MVRRIRQRVTNNIALEALEPRQMLAADVDFNSLTGALEIRGDDTPNTIEINAIDPSTVEVTINGGTPIEIVDPICSIDIRTGSDADVVLLNTGGAENLTLSGDLSVRTGAGADTLAAFGVDVGNHAFINTGRDSDFVELIDTHVGGDLNLMTHDGDDLVVASDLTVDADVVALLGDGMDILDAGFFSADDVFISSGKGDDLLSVYAFQIGGDLDILAGQNGDQVELFKATDVAGDGVIGGELRLFTGAGDDIATLESITVTGNTYLFTGAGADQVVIIGETTFGGFAIINLGGGDDTLIVDSTVEFSDHALLLGAGGHDTLYGDPEFLDALALSFEDVV